MKPIVECVNCIHNEDCKGLWSWLNEYCLKNAKEKEDDETEERDVRSA